MVTILFKQATLTLSFSGDRSPHKSGTGLLTTFETSLYPLEFFDAAVIGLFYIVREKTGGQFSRLPMILNTFAADALSTAGFIGTVAPCLIFFDFTLQRTLL